MHTASELIFVGLGLSGTGGMTVDALEALRQCDRIYGEFYTSSVIGADTADLEKAIGKRIEVVCRADVEEGHQIIEDAMRMRVGFVTAGDTMLATTHIDLRIQAKYANIPVRIFNGVSIFSAVPTAFGLQPYKFGRTVTLPFLERNYQPKSPYDNIKENRDRGLHTLILLDIRAEELRYMTAKEAIEWLLAGEERWQEGLITDATLLCVVSHAGAPDQRIFCNRPRELLETDLGAPLHSLVLPGNLHFMEAEALVDFAGAPPEIIEDDGRWRDVSVFRNVPPRASAGTSRRRGSSAATTVYRPTGTAS